MEGQWEARDTHNAELADACIAFLTNEKREHDGTKATLNIFTMGRYAHFGSASHWETDVSSAGSLEVLAEVETMNTPDGKPGPHVNVVAFKLLTNERTALDEQGPRRMSISRVFITTAAVVAALAIAIVVTTKRR